MTARTILSVWTAALALAACPLAPAQTDFDAIESDTAPAERHVKRPGFFRRPVMSTASEQLRYADSLREAGRLSKAARQYDRLVRAWPNAPEAATAQQACAAILEQRGKLQRAFDEYQYLVDRYANFFDYNAVLDRQFEIASRVLDARYRFLLVFPRRSPGKALPMFESLVRNGPNWKQTARCQFHIATIHEEAKDYDMAVVAYQTLQHMRPDNELAAEAAFGQARCLYRLAKKSPNDESARWEAIAFLRHFAREWSASPHIGEASEYLATLEARQVKAAYDRAAFYDKIARKPQAARIAYAAFLEQFPDSDLAAEARRRMSELEPAATDAPAGEAPRAQ